MDAVTLVPDFKEHSDRQTGQRSWEETLNSAGLREVLVGGLNSEVEAEWREATETSARAVDPSSAHAPVFSFCEEQSRLPSCVLLENLHVLL